MKTIALLTFAFMMASCYSGMDDDYTYIQPEIRPYYEKFVQEAKKRGVELDTYGVKISFGPMSHDGQQGVTSYRYREMKIDSSSYRWKNYPESLIFHELGHLLLHREHNDERIDYNPTSIMDSQEIPEYELGRADLREYYLNELFNPSTESPENF
jgi:hypothetical protein